MSAFLCSDKHVSMIAQAAYNNRFDLRYSLEEINFNDRGEIAQMLLDENIKSLFARYPNDKDDNRHKVMFNIPPDWADLNPLAYVQLIRCYQYQSCEHEGWESSKAKKLTDVLEKKLVSKAIELAGLNQTFWGV